MSQEAAEGAQRLKTVGVPRGRARWRTEGADGRAPLGGRLHRRRARPAPGRRRAAPPRSRRSTPRGRLTGAPGRRRAGAVLAPIAAGRRRAGADPAILAHSRRSRAFANDHEPLQHRRTGASEIAATGMDPAGGGRLEVMPHVRGAPAGRTLARRPAGAPSRTQGKLRSLLLALLALLLFLVLLLVLLLAHRPLHAGPVRTLRGPVLPASQQNSSCPARPRLESRTPTCRYLT